MMKTLSPQPRNLNKIVPENTNSHDKNKDANICNSEGR